MAVGPMNYKNIINKCKLKNIINKYNYIIE